MENTIFKIGQVVYQIAVNAITELPIIKEFEVLCVGEKSIYVKGNDPVFDVNGESVLHFTSMDSFQPSNLMSFSYYNVWTDSLVRAEQYCSIMLEIVKYKNNLKKSA